MEAGGGGCLSQEGPMESFWNIIRQRDLQEVWPRYIEGIMDCVVVEMAISYSKTLAKTRKGLRHTGLGSSLAQFE